MWELKIKRRTPRGLRRKKLTKQRKMKTKGKTHPTREAWIEFEKAKNDVDYWAVAALAGCVDCYALDLVSEGPLSRRTPRGVRGLKYIHKTLLTVLNMSHPSRGAWIEICKKRILFTASLPSHPSRGAWIEIVHPTRCLRPPAVAPLAGCVD